MLSFTTTLSVAVEQGIAVYPYPWASEAAPAYAEERGAILALGRRSRAGPTGAVSLSPSSFDGISGIERVVLPSPNGSAISFALGRVRRDRRGRLPPQRPRGGEWLRSATGRVMVVAAGERWPDGSLRPAAEDLWGAGAVLHALGMDDASARGAAGGDGVRRRAGRPAPPRCSTAPAVASWSRTASRATWRSRRPYDVSEVVPVLHGEAFVDAVDQVAELLTPLTDGDCQVTLSRRRRSAEASYPPGPV